MKEQQPSPLPKVTRMRKRRWARKLKPGKLIEVADAAKAYADAWVTALRCSGSDNGEEKTKRLAHRKLMILLLEGDDLAFAFWMDGLIHRRRHADRSAPAQ